MHSTRTAVVGPGSSSGPGQGKGPEGPAVQEGSLFGAVALARMQPLPEHVNKRGSQGARPPPLPSTLSPLPFLLAPAGNREQSGCSLQRMSSWTRGKQEAVGLGPGQ